MHKKGSIFGILSGIFWSLDSLVLGIIFSYPIMLQLGFKSSLITTLIHDLISFIFLFFYLLKVNKLKEFFSVLTTKSGIVIILAAILGGPLGMGAYMLSINYLGANFSATFSSIYPLVGIFLAYMFLNEKLKLHNIIGVIISVLAIILVTFSPESKVDIRNIGLITLFVTVIGWGSEAVIISFALKDDVSSEVALSIRQMTSVVFYTLFVLPFVGFDGLIQVVNDFSIIGFIATASILGTFSYMFYYKSIDYIGPTQAMGLNISYPAWTLLFSYLIYKQFNIKEFSLTLLIIWGSILSNDNPKEFLNLFRKK